MKPNELRIGNLIDRQDYICRVIQIDAQGIMTDPIEYKGERFVKQEIKPILLTEEWLLKFGFEEKEFGGKCFENKELLIYPENGEFRIFAMKFAKGSLMYVHQLQNLYFAFTGNELILK